MRRLEFGWFVPTSGDTDAYGHAEAFVPPSMEMFERVTRAAEAAGFEYILIPVQTACWEAWITSAMLVARTKSIKPLVAARPGYINPALLAKMISAFDQLSGGRVCINLIAGASDEEAAADGITFAKEQRYALMDEEVTLLKALWSATGRVDFDGAFHKLKGALIVPKTLQKPWPPFYLGGGSKQAWEISAKHSDVHLFWGDAPERIGQQIQEIRELARRHDRHDAIGFGMRLQVIVREREADAWAAADRLIADLGERHKARIANMFNASEANRRMKELARTEGMKIGPHLWTGLTLARPGAGVAVVGDPEQVAGTLQQFIDVGCHSFCLSGYLHDEEAERFGRLVMPLLKARNASRMAAA